MTTSERARNYVAKMPPAISGQGGHSQTLAAASVLVHGFELSEGDALPILSDYSARCVPPWREADLRHKLADAAKGNHPKPRGHLLGESRVSRTANTVAVEPKRSKPTFPNFAKGTRADFDQLAKLRGIGLEGIEFASERGLLWFATLKNCPAWIITDADRFDAQARRMDGNEWEHVQAKAWTLPGSWASWPIGIREAQPFPAIALCEGGPDFIACHYLSLWEQAGHYSKRDVQCAPVAMLGGTLNIHPDALPLFKGKRVRIFGHDDDTGRKSVTRWAGQLAGIAAAVDAFSFDGLTRADGAAAKDLNDCLHLDTEGHEQTERILP